MALLLTVFVDVGFAVVCARCCCCLWMCLMLVVVLMMLILLFVFVGVVGVVAVRNQ